MSRNEFGFLVAALIGIILITFLVTTLPMTGYFDETATIETSSQPDNIYQKTDPMLVVPESTLGEKPAQYIHNWDDNPVATIPESTIGQYSHNWDANPVATIPESTMSQQPQQYIHNWDDNPVSTIPESTMSR